MSRWIKASLIGFSLILLAVATLAWFLLMTAPGARLVLEFVEPRIPGALSYEELDGRLIGPLELEGVRYEHEAVEVRVEWLAGDWQPLAWWIHDHLPYSELQFFRKLAAFNIGWRENPKRTIYGYTAPRGFLTKPGMANHEASHGKFYRGFPRLRRNTR